MAQFDIHRFVARNAGFIYVVDLQDQFLRALATRIVAPLYPLEAGAKPILRLNPIVEIEGKPYYIAIQEMSALRAKALGEQMTTLRERRAEIIAAIDLLFSGV
jgi:toxin CcdB